MQIQFSRQFYSSSNSTQAVPGHRQYAITAKNLGDTGKTVTRKEHCVTLELMLHIVELLFGDSAREGAGERPIIVVQSATMNCGQRSSTHWKRGNNFGNAISLSSVRVLF